MIKWKMGKLLIHSSAWLWISLVVHEDGFVTAGYWLCSYLLVVGVATTITSARKHLVMVRKSDIEELAELECRLDDEHFRREARRLIRVLRMLLD